MKKLTEKQAIERFNSIYGDRYDYSVMGYTNWVNNITVGCRIHGLFSVSPHHHYRGSECRKCLGYVYDRDSFIFKSGMRHKNKYDYSLSDYNGSKSKIIIICPTHGSFNQLPNDHLGGKGCRKCATDIASENYTIKIEEAKNRMMERYKGKYSYDLYIKQVPTHEKISIVCWKHGVFHMTIANHMTNGHGCRKCALDVHIGSYNETLMNRYPEKYKNKECFFYIFQIEVDRKLFKLGISNSPKRRLSHCHGKDRKIILSIKSNVYDCVFLEKKVFDMYASKRMTYGVLGGRTEHFLLDRYDIELISMFADIFLC